jgi:nitrite reductase/ring-hydroxylating ferredoxin subunit
VSWQRVCRVEEVVADRPVGRVVGAPDGGEQRICVVAGPDGAPVAMPDRCPHRDIALSGGLVRDGVLTCPGHFWRFDLGTGRRTDLPEVSVPLYPTRVTDGWVEVSVPPPPRRTPMREWLLAEARSRRPG